ncbi:MAG: beta-N-acetylhexosaminidase [Flavobacteriaceae bacterium]|nr:beta-N-acetylhexosaminidase [Flavobacteriaceae bacterium]
MKYLLTLIAALLVSCGGPVYESPNALEALPLIPKPRSVVSELGGFGYSSGVAVIAEDPLLDDLKAWVPEGDAEGAASGPIVLALGYPHASAEAYRLTITRSEVRIQGTSPAGVFRGLQTLRQILAASTPDPTTRVRVLPLGVIEDAPELSYRGTMLDVARHFFTVAEVKQYIDQIAQYKINALHLHLSDDQGWRIEIKAYPRLTEIGAATEVGGGPGGYYTQEDFLELQNYAAQRFIQIIPEIDMPGHTNAAIVAYPELNGNGKAVSPYTGTAVGFSTFDARNEAVYTFIDQVVQEISALSTSPYFHLGGDESHVTSKEDYVFFVERVGEIIRTHQKTPIGWDEVAQTDLGPGSVAQFWSSEKNALAAADKKMKVLMSPAKKAYLDMQYDSLSPYGLHWAGYISVQDAYNWDPLSYVPGLDADQILGIEAPLWSETISDSSGLEYLAFPRLIGLAELGWTPQSLRSWEDFNRRLTEVSYPGKQAE